MVKCPKCGKELKHKGALNGHLAFTHGVITPKQLKLDEMRNELRQLRLNLDKIMCYFRVFEVEKDGKQIKYLTCYDSQRESNILLKELSNWRISAVDENGNIVVLKIVDD